MVLTPRGRIVDIRNIDMFDNNNIGSDTGKAEFMKCFELLSF